MENVVNQTVKERLKSFIKFKGISVRAFESTCGFSYGFVANMRNSMQPDKVMRIAQYFPELNSGWLLAGEGEMLRSAEKNDVPADVEPQPSPSEMLAAIVAKLDTLEKRLADECAQRDRLMGIVENQQNLIAKLAEVGVMEKTI